MFRCEAGHIFESPLSVVTVGEENVPSETLECPTCGAERFAALSEEYGWGV